MSKDKQIQRNCKSVEQLQEIIPKYYAIITANRRVNFKKGLYEFLDPIFPPGKPYNTWKGYFLYPERIPAFGKEQVLQAMWQAINLQIQKMEDAYRSELDTITKRTLELEKKFEEINNFKKEYHGNR